jgi:hypothetical protein
VQPSQGRGNTFEGRIPCLRLQRPRAGSKARPAPPLSRHAGTGALLALQHPDSQRRQVRSATAPVPRLSDDRPRVIDQRCPRHHQRPAQGPIAIQWARRPRTPATPLRHDRAASALPVLRALSSKQVAAIRQLTTARSVAVDPQPASVASCRRVLGKPRGALTMLPFGKPKGGPCGLPLGLADTKWRAPASGSLLRTTSLTVAEIAMLTENVFRFR